MKSLMLRTGGVVEPFDDRSVALELLEVGG